MKTSKLDSNNQSFISKGETVLNHILAENQLSEIKVQSNPNKQGEPSGTRQTNTTTIPLEAPGINATTVPLEAPRINVQRPSICPRMIQESSFISKEDLNSEEVKIKTCDPTGPV